MIARERQLGTTQDEARQEGKNVVQRYNDLKSEWAAFCLFPEIIDPTRMPCHFPVYSHIVKRQTTFTVQPGANGLMSSWIPDAVWRTDGSTANVWPASTNFNGAGLWVGVDATSANQQSAANNDIASGTGGAFGTLGAANTYTFTSADVFGYLSNFPSILNLTIDRTGSPSGDVQLVLPPNPTPTLQWFATPSVTSSVAHGGQRLIGAFIEFEYIGTQFDHSGTIEVGLHYHAIDDDFSAKTAHFMSPGEIIQAPYYKRFSPNQGARCVWTPIDNNDFNFQKTNLDAGYGVPNAGNSIGRRQGRPMRMEWAINMLGFQPGQNVRVHMCSFYETIPDEKDRDLYNTAVYKGKLGVQQAQQVVQQALQSGVNSTPAKRNWIHDSANAVQSVLRGINDYSMGFSSYIPGFDTASKMLNVAAEGAKTVSQFL